MAIKKQRSKKKRGTWAIGDSYHTFTLKVPGNDKLKVIKQIEKSSNFKVLDELTDELSYRNTELSRNARITSKYETKDTYRATFCGSVCSLVF